MPKIRSSRVGAVGKNHFPFLKRKSIQDYYLPLSQKWKEVILRIFKKLKEIASSATIEVGIRDA